MSITVSPLDLILDTQNPRFVILANREQPAIRKYLVTYEDVCQLATDINEYGSLLPGERIVVLRENDNYIVVEGNRRTCSLQLLLSRELIPDGFTHRIPPTSAAILEQCATIEVDELPSRETALALMTKRHIEGVKQWKPLAKKQFFAANYNDGQGQSIRNLSRITSIREGEIKEDIRDYKFFHQAYQKHCTTHPDFNKEIIVLKTDPFWRMFKAKFEYPSGNRVSPTDFLKISYDDTCGIQSALDMDLFEQITQLVFEKAIVAEAVNTRNVLTDVQGILPLLETVYQSTQAEQSVESEPPTETDVESNGVRTPDDSTGDSSPPSNTPSDNNEAGRGQPEDLSGGPRPGGPPPRSFFETISWRNKLNPSNSQHQGLLYAINELYGLSNSNCGRQKVYKLFPIATGMILRTVYEQALRVRLLQVNLWNDYLRSIQNGRRLALPTLSSMENFISQGANKSIVFPDQSMILCYDRVIAATHRDYLNANIHCPGDINVTPESLESIAQGGMYALVQSIINLL